MVELYYKDDMTSLYLGDCIVGMNQLPENCGDVIFTSPPY